MAQPQPQAPAQVPPRAYSPPQPTPSPAASQSSFALPPNKRVRTDGPPSQPESPYASSPYAASPGAAGTPPATAGSPAYTQSPALPTAYSTPYTNGHATPGLNLPDSRPNSTPPVQPQHHLPTPLPQYTAATMAPALNQALAPAQGPGAMGPPQRPADRPTKDYEYDVTDSLAGTGIDLRAEEQYMNDLYSNNFDISDARTGFAHHHPGPKSTFYGAGPANQPAQSTPDQSQDQFTAQQAERAWSESSMRLAVQRTQEIGDPFLLVAMLHRRAERIAREHHLNLNLDLKNNAQTMGKMRLPEQFAQPKVTIKVTPGPESTMVHTTGSYIPHDAFLVDQLALMSIATKQRLRELVGDASAIASNRQKTSHGDVPEEWAAAAAPMNAEPLGQDEGEKDDTNGENVDGDGTGSLKRSGDAAGLGSSPAPKKLLKISSYMTTTMRELARQEREWEEARLRKRQHRKDGIPDSGTTTSRAGSVAPGTPGSVAPEPEKALTKKEMKKNQALKAAEANSHANQNMTSSMFAGLGGKGGLFGKKKTGKTYDWMNVGRGGSGASTPTRNTPGPGKGAPGAPAPAAPANLAMTTEGRNRLGTWREDKEKGRNIQLRDWGEAGAASHKLLSILVLVVISVANSISTKASTRLNSLFVLLKFISIAAVVIAALAVVGIQVSHPDGDIGGRDWFTRSWFDYRKSHNPDGTETDWTRLSQWDIFGHYSAALYGALWAYSGWDKAIYVSAELSEPARQLPLAINTSIPTAIICFLAANAAYYILLPWDVVSTTDSVAVTAITRLLGQGFGIAAAILICLVVAGSLLGNGFVASRMTVAAANRSWIPKVFTIIGKFGAKPKTDNNDAVEEGSDAPVNAIVLSAILSTIYIILGNFRALITLNGLGEYSFFFITVLGAAVLRYKEPNLKRPYKPWVLNHVVFLLVSGFVVVRGAVFAPLQAVVIICLWLLGLIYYHLRLRQVI